MSVNLNQARCRRESGGCGLMLPAEDFKHVIDGKIVYLGICKDCRRQLCVESNRKQKERKRKGL